MVILKSVWGVDPVRPSTVVKTIVFAGFMHERSEAAPTL